MSVPVARKFPFLLPLLLLAACGSSSDSSGFAVRTTTKAAEASAPLVVAGDWMVYFASESFTSTGLAGTDLNTNDSDATDQVAVAVNLRTNVETNIAVAALGAAIVDNEIYLVVDEALDGFDWNGVGGIGDIVLVHWSAASGTPVFVDTLDLGFAGERPLSVNDRLIYASASVPTGDETNLRRIETSAPLTPVVISNELGGGPVEAHLLAQKAGLVFCEIDETGLGADQDGDGDATDEHVLALVDPTATAALKSVSLAMQSESDPLAARALGTSDWLVAFLVDETDQGGTNFNDQSRPEFAGISLLPENCPVSDSDALDQVLFFLDFSDFLGGAPAVNTGVAGRDRVVVMNGFVATISDEADASCNLNADTGDTDTNDEVARWVSIATHRPDVEPSRLHALATSTGGGSMGLSVLDDKLIAVIDEGDDSSNLDSKVQDHQLVAWLDPALGTPVWHLSHQSQTSGCCGANPPTPCRFGTGVFDSDCDSEPFAGTNWMAAEAVGDRLALVFLEDVPGTNPNVGSLNTNLDCALVAKDTDKTDGLPVWADFETGPTLDFDGVGYAVDLNNPGIAIVGSFAYFRVSEAADNRDYNADGQLNDVVLFRNPLVSCGPVPMATSSLAPGQVITTDGLRGAAFISSEPQANIDFNEDGDKFDQVVRFFSF
jgi:hypothetical protein